MYILGLTGRKGSGKNSFANFIQDATPPGWSHSFHEVSFANPLKQACYCIFGGEERNWWGEDKDKDEVCEFWDKKLNASWPKEKQRPVTYRFLMQYVGTELFRNQFFNDIWISKLEQTIEEIRRNDDMAAVLVTDVRFDNEAKFIENLGGQVWRIVNLNQPSLNPDAHASEKGVSDSYVRVVVEAQNLKELRASADHFFENL